MKPTQECNNTVHMNNPQKSALWPGCDGTGVVSLDVQVLLAVFQALIDNGATVIVIEHDLNVIRSADNIIDMGPGGGESGGRVIASGTPEGTRYIMEQTPSTRRLAVVHRTTALNCSSPLRKNKEQVIPTGTTCSWYAGRDSNPRPTDS